MAIEYQDVVYDGGANPLNNPHAVDVTEVGGNIYAVVGGGDNSLAVYGIDSDPMSPTFGELTDTPVSTYVDDATVGLQNIRDIDSIEIDGVRYIFAGGDEGGISAFSLDAAGTLTNVDNVFDTDDPTNLELANLKSITTAAVDDGAGGTNSSSSAPETTTASACFRWPMTAR